MFKKYKKILSIVITLLFIGIFAWYIASNWSQFQGISLVSPLFLVVSAGLIILNLYSLGKLFELAIEPHGIKLSRNEIFGLSVLTRFSKQVSPAYIGATIRAVYLKKNYNVSYAKFSSSFMLSNLLQLITSGSIALLIYFFSEKTLLNSGLITTVFLVVVLFVAMIYGPVSFFVAILKSKTKRFTNKIIERIVAALGYYDKLRAQPKTLLPMLIWVLITLASTAAALLTLYASIGLGIDSLSALFIAAIVSWSMVFSITPAGIGVREGLMVFGAGLINIPIPETLTVAILLRFVTFFVVGTLSIYYAPRLLGTTILNMKNVKT